MFKDKGLAGIFNSRGFLPVVFFGLIGLSFIVWNGFGSLQNRSLQDETHAVTLITARQSEIRFQGISQACERLSRTVNTTSLSSNPEDTQKINDFLRKYPAIDSLYITDDLFHPIAGFPSFDPNFNIKALNENPTMIHALIPIYEGVILTGFLIGQIDMHGITREIFEEYQGLFNLRIEKNGIILFELGSWSSDKNYKPYRELISFDEENRFTAQVIPTRNHKRKTQWGSGLVFFLCLLLSLVVSLLIRNAQRNQALSALNLRHYRELLESVELAAYTIDLTGVITFSNAYLLSVTGYREEELHGKRIFDTLIPHLGEKERDLWKKKLESREIERHEEIEIQTKDGERRVLRLNNTLQFNTQGVVIGSSSIGEDITEQKQLEKDNRELAQQLSISQRMDSLGKLAGGIAHDFNNLLVPIIGYSEIGLDQVPPGELHRCFSQIKEAGEKASSLTKQILAFSRKQVLEMQILDLNQLLLAFQPMLSRLIGENIETIWNLFPAEILIKADKSQLEQIIMNLSVNARDAMEEGGKLTIGTTLDADNYTVLTIADTGTGMTEEVKQHIFEPFFTTKSSEKGTGLGLSTVFGIVKQHEGTIDVRTKINEGCTFYLRFPTTEMTFEKQKESSFLPRDLHGNEQVILVEDNQQVLRLMETVLRSNGYRVESFDDPLKAITALIDERIDADLILSDVIMPNHNGLSMMKIVWKERPNIPTLFISGYTNTEIIKHMAEYKDLKLLNKPFTAEVLLKKVRDVLDS